MFESFKHLRTGFIASVNYLYTRPVMLIAGWGEPARVDVTGSGIKTAEPWYMKNGVLVVFNINGRVAHIQNFNTSAH